MNGIIESFCEYSFPFQFTLGIGGNVITLIILVSRTMRSSTNTMLALASICDIIYLIAMCPNQMSRWPSLVYLPCFDDLGQQRKCFTTFAYFYLNNKTHLTFLINWMSASSTWLIVFVSFDRLWAIKSPFAARHSRCPKKEIVVIPMIFLITCIFNFHTNFSFEVYRQAGGYSRLISTQNSALLHFLTILNVLTQILIPTLLLITINACLIYYLKNRRAVFEPRGVSVRSFSSRSEPLLKDGGSSTARSSGGMSNVWFKQIGKAERHVTVTVSAIATAYLVSHFPSAVLYAYMYLFHHNQMYGQDWMYTAVALSSSVVTWSKIANFLLFCMSSKHFRQEMKKKFCNWFNIPEGTSLKDSSLNQQNRTRSLAMNVICESSNTTPAS